MGLVRPATPGFLVTLVATILLLVVSFSVPWFKSVFFLKVAVTQSNQSGFITFGVLGYCTSLNNSALSCTKAQVGYEFNANTLLGDNINFLQIPTVVTKWITWALVLHIVAFGLAGISAIFGLLAHVREMAMSCFSSCVSGFAAVVALLAFIFDLVLFFTAKARINSIHGGSAVIGSAVWLTLAAWVLLFFSGCFYTFGRCCISRRTSGAKDQTWRGGDVNNAPKTDYAEMMRLDAVKAEADRKARQAAGERGLPAFPGIEERKPLSNYEATYLEDEEEAVPSPYRDERNVAGAGAGAARVAGPRSPRRQTSTPSQATRSGYDGAAFDTAYTPGQYGSRAIDQYNDNNTQPSYPPPTAAPSRTSQRQPSVPTQAPYPGYAPQAESYPTYGSPSPNNAYRNQQPSGHDQTSGYQAYTGTAAAVAGTAAAYATQHQNYQSDSYSHPYDSSQQQYGNDQYLSAGGQQYGHGQDQTTYHSAVSHSQDLSRYSQPQQDNTYQVAQEPYGHTSQNAMPNPHEVVGAAAYYAGSSVPAPNEGFTYPSTGFLPSHGSEKDFSSPHTSYYTPPTRQATGEYPEASYSNNLPVPPNPPRPQSNATSYFPHGARPVAQQDHTYNQYHSSPAGLHPVQEASNTSAAENPPEYEQNQYYPVGWDRKS